MSKGLEAYEIVKEECGYAFGQTANGVRVRKSLPIIEKELKALEIIKNKNVDTRDLFVVFDWFGRGEEELALNDYNSRHKTDEEYNNITLTQEEYELLKEVLL